MLFSAGGGQAEDRQRIKGGQTGFRDRGQGGEVLWRKRRAVGQGS